MKNIIVLLFVLLSLNISGQKVSAVTVSDTLNFDKIQYHPLKMGDGKGLESLDLDLDQFNVYLAGENHGYRYANTKMQLELLKYLNKTQGVRALLMEFGYSRGFMVDQYINNIADSNLLSVFEIYSFKEYSYFYQELRKYNLQQQPSNRIHVYGIDVERFYALSLHLLMKQFKTIIPHDSIALHFEALRGLASYKQHKYVKNQAKSRAISYNTNSFYAKATIIDVLKNMDDFPQYWEAMLKGDKQVYLRIVQELKDYITYRSYENQTQQYVYRERYMYSNFKKFHKEHPGVKAFGQFGRCHVSSSRIDEACNWYSFDALATRINSDTSSWLNGRVCSLPYFYKDDKTFESSIKDNGKIADILNKSLEMDTFVLIKVLNDSNLFGNYYKWYNYIISINKTTELDRKDFTEEIDTIEEAKESDNDFFAIFAGYRYSQFDGAQLIAFLTQKSYTGFNASMPSIYFGMGNLSLQSWTLDYAGGIYLKQDIYSNTDTSNLNFKGGYFLSNVGYNVLKSKYIFLRPMFGIGVNSFTMTIEQEGSKQNPRLNYFGAPLREEFSTTQFIMDGGLEMIFRIKVIGLGLKYGYQYAIGNSKWKNANSNPITLSPDFSARGTYFMANLYLIFNI